jgi:gliding motility-associated-like protein
MIKKLLWITGLLATHYMWGQTCPDPVYPLDGATDIPVDATIQWTPVSGVTAYSIKIGTTPEGAELVSATSTGQNTFFKPPFGLPDQTTIHVTISLFILSQGNVVCTSFSFNTLDVTAPPNCTVILSPANGATNVPVSSNVRWAYSPTATGYLIFAGTSAGGTDLANGISVTTGLQWEPPSNFQPGTTYHVTVIPFNENGEAQPGNGNPCSEIQFTTGSLNTVPDCPQIIYPPDGAVNVPLSPIIKWEPVSEANGYRLSLGTSPQLNDILDHADFRNVNQTGVLDFDSNRIYYITLTAYNDAGEAANCIQTSFSTIEGCGPYLNAFNYLIDRRPQTSFPDSVRICTNAEKNTVITTDLADGYRWYKINPNGTQSLQSEGSTFNIPEAGQYRYELYNQYSDFECTNWVNFVALVSEAPIIEATNISLENNKLNIEVITSGSGSYVYALDNPDGSYQNSNKFFNLPIGFYRVYVRDVNGCGISEAEVKPELDTWGFPPFFTPNGDGNNETWKMLPIPALEGSLKELFIYNRHGKLLAYLKQGDSGWNGEYGGHPMPEGDYWYRAITPDGKVITGHFALKR